MASPQFAALLAQCREEEPDVRIQMFEAPLEQQILGRCNDEYVAALERHLK